MWWPLLGCLSQQREAQGQTAPVSEKSHVFQRRQMRHVGQFLIDFLFQSSFGLTAKLNRKYRELFYSLHSTPHLPTKDSLILNIHHQSEIFVTTSESTWTRHYHPKATVSINVAQSMVSDQCIRTCIHRYSIMQNRVTAIKFILEVTFFEWVTMSLSRVPLTHDYKQWLKSTEMYSLQFLRPEVLHHGVSKAILCGGKPYFCFFKCVVASGISWFSLT